MSWRVLTAISIDPSARAQWALGRDDKIGVASGPPVGMTRWVWRRFPGRDDTLVVIAGPRWRHGWRRRISQHVIPSEAATICHSDRVSDASERRNLWVLGRSALSPHSIDPSARARWALGRDDKIGVASGPRSG